MSVVGVVDGQTTSGLNGPVEKKAKKMDSKKSSSSSSSSKLAKAEKSVKSSSSRPLAASSTDQGKSSSSSTDGRFSELDKKWSDRFNRLEALLLAKTVDQPQQSVFSTVKVTPSHAPPANVVRPDPFLKPAPQTSQLTDPAVDSPAQGSVPSLKRISRSMRGQDGSCSNRQYHGSSLHQQGGRYEVRPTLCPAMENLDLVYQQASYSEGTTHSRSSECGGRQTIQAGTDHSNRMVPSPTSLSKDLRKVAPTSNRSFCNKIQQQAPPLCLTGSGPRG